jgi:hypothetical protein
MNKKERIRKKHKKIMQRKARKVVCTYRNLVKFKPYIFGYREKKPITIRYNDCTSNIIKRLPTDREIIAYRQWALKYMYLCGHEMKRSAYYTLKGMNRRNNNEENIMNFIRKRNPELADRIEEYKQTEQAILQWQFPTHISINESIEIATIDLDLAKEDADE